MFAIFCNILQYFVICNLIILPATAVRDTDSSHLHMGQWGTHFAPFRAEEIYDESCTFTDEIDTYQKDKFIKGTKALFVGSESNVQLVGDVDVLDGGKKIQFRFQETLAWEP